MNKLLGLICVCAVALISGSRAAGAASAGASPEQILRQLLEGNQRFVNRALTHPDATPSAAAQHPLAVILSCADSRVPPELIFDQGVGRLFVVRAAGNTYDRLGLQSIVYAIAHLGTRLVLVMGHDQCGAVAAAVKAYPKPGTGPMLENIYPAIAAVKGAPGDELANAIDMNAILTARRLADEPELAAKVKSGEVKILPARYSLATGAVRLLPAH
ncbi:MAG TPA: carbonic anhydrase [Candidatus Binataceae bacterium]|nr:carbonic anhydrase [Candidatus Binataceae bacterium]